jgi:hypothetical protein
MRMQLPRAYADLCWVYLELHHARNEVCQNEYCETSLEPFVIVDESQLFLNPFF